MGGVAMNREQAIPYVSFVVDDALNGRRLGFGINDIRESEPFNHASILIGWQCGFEPLFVAVHSYLDVELDDDEAIELATDFLSEREWFASEPSEPDYLLR
jgi:hypothetical protein